MIRRYTLNTSTPSASDSNTLKESLFAMDVNQIMAFALEHDIDIGAATSQQGIYKKVVVHLDAESPQ